jgi:hypothetical protein
MNGNPPVKLLEEFNQRCGNLTPKNQELARFDFDHGWNDFFYFAKRILGYQFEDLPHRESCNFISDARNPYKLFLAPRGSYKTSQISQAYPVWKIIKNPNIRILLDSVSLSNSEDNNKVIERHLEHNDRLKFLYGNHASKKQKWNDNEFVSALRTSIDKKEPTVRASAQGKIQIGPHYDLIIGDDEHDKDNFKTVEQVQKVKQHLRLLFGLLDPGGEIIFGGHRWAYTDAYSMLMGDTDNPEELKFSEIFTAGKLIRSAEDEQGRLYFPKVLTRERLKHLRDTLGRDLYNAQLMNEPVVAGESATFSTRYFKLYQKLPDILNWFLTVDPGGEKKKSDEWVFFLGGIDNYANKYFTRYIKTPCRISEAAEIIYQFFMKLGNASLADAKARAADMYARPITREKGTPFLKDIGFETTGQQGSILTSIKEYIWNKYRIAIHITPLIHNSDSKAERIEALGPEYEMGKIYHSPQMSETHGLEDQLLKFPKGKDDLADAASMQREVARTPKIKVEEKQPISLDDRITRHLLDREKGRNQIRRQHPIMGTD